MRHFSCLLLSLRLILNSPFGPSSDKQNILTSQQESLQTQGLRGMEVEAQGLKPRINDLNNFFES